MKKLICILILLSLFLLTACAYTDERLAKNMVWKFANDDNYMEFTGTVVETRDTSLVVLKSNDLSEYFGQSLDDEYWCLIFSKDDILPEIGSEIQFVTVPYHFYNGYYLPIVELTIDGETLFPFEEGKDLLIKWAYRFAETD